MRVKRVKVITSHSGHADFLASLETEGEGETCPKVAGYLPRPEGEEMGLPRDRYRYSPSNVFYRHPTFGAVTIIETRHRRFEVWRALPGTALRDREG